MSDGIPLSSCAMMSVCSDSESFLLPSLADLLSSFSFKFQFEFFVPLMSQTSALMLLRFSQASCRRSRIVVCLSLFAICAVKKICVVVNGELNEEDETRLRVVKSIHTG